MKSESDKKDPLPKRPPAIKPQQIIPPTTRNSSSLTSNGLQDDKHQTHTLYRNNSASNGQKYDKQI